MAEQPTELRRINWSECFSFTQIFRTFRMAIHPSKLGLALAGLVLMALWGWILDAVWTCSECRPVDGEVNAFWQVPDVETWRKSVKASYPERLTQAYLAMEAEPPGDPARKLDQDPDGAVAEALDKRKEVHAKAVEDLTKGKGEEDAASGRDRRAAIAELARQHGKIKVEIEGLKPRGVFASFLSFETGVVRQLIEAARGLNVAGKISEVVSARTSSAPSQKSLEDVGGQMRALLSEQDNVLSGFLEAAEKSAGSSSPTALRYESVRTGPGGIGVLSCIVLMLRGVQWLVLEHWLFAVPFLLVSLAIWSLFGGAICRIAALNVARDERISPKAALSFARQKFLGFLTAPLLPVGLIIVIGACIFVGGLVMAIPYFGDIVGGVGMGVALLGGFVMALVAVGAVAGMGLMWPTIAVEGSDSFDAMSRSYSYIYSRPWRAGFYAAVATVYGALCYLFARFFVLVLLKATRFFLAIGMGVFRMYRPRTGLAGGQKIDALWPHPAFEGLRVVAPPFGAESWGDTAAAFLIGIWVLLLVTLLYALLVSFFFSGSTIIYYLLRHKVDATDMEDVYLEEDEEEERPEEEELPPAPEAPAAISEPPPGEPPLPEEPPAKEPAPEEPPPETEQKSQEPPASDESRGSPGG